MAHTTPTSEIARRWPVRTIVGSCMLITAIAIAVPATMVGADASVGTSVADAPVLRLQLDSLSPAQTDAVLSAVELFAAAGLVLSDLIVHGGEDLAACDGHQGLHRPHGTWSEISLCGTGTPVRHVVLHELAHAWASASLTAERQERFQELRGFAHWRDYDHAAWSENGTEQAAEIIAWGIDDRVAPLQIEYRSCAELRAGYEALTGGEPPQGLTAICTPVQVDHA